MDERQRVKQWLAGHRAAEQRIRESRGADGPRPAQAVAESLSALDAMYRMGLWPGPRDPIDNRGVEIVRARWAKVEHRARRARTR